jgi:hypothetical protein
MWSEVVLFWCQWNVNYSKQTQWTPLNWVYNTVDSLRFTTLTKIRYYKDVTLCENYVRDFFIAAILPVRDGPLFFWRGGMDISSTQTIFFGVVVVANNFFAPLPSANNFFCPSDCCGFHYKFFRRKLFLTTSPPPSPKKFRSVYHFRGPKNFRTYQHFSRHNTNFPDITK